jgi:penicillin-insensitive murein endopeptidase
VETWNGSGPVVLATPGSTSDTALAAESLAPQPGKAASQPEPPREPQRAPAQAAEPEASAGAASSATCAESIAIDPLTAPPSLTTSIGGPSNGRLRGGIPLPASGPGFVSNPRRPNPEACYGTVETIRALVRAAARVHEEMPGSELYISDIGFREGGPIPHHGSHQAGRDVDVLFYYLLEREDTPYPGKGIPIDPQGRGWDFGDLRDPRDDVRVRLDLPRTWRFIQALIEDDLAGEGGLVQRIFVAEHVRTLLLQQAERAGAPREVRARFEAVTCQPGYPHDDHLHVRFFCSAEDLREGCADGSPMYPWRRQQLAEEGLEPVMATGRPRVRAPSAPSAPPRTPEEAAARAIAAAGSVHPRVRAFLQRRAQWSIQPHPGRPYCR